MQEFFPFFIILLIAVIFSQLFSRMRIPWVVSLLVGGIVAGPNGLGWFEPDSTIDFLATIGLVFLMFMAGLESKLTEVKGLKAKIAIVSTLIGILPGLVGIWVTLSFGYDLTTAILMGIIFMASAIALLIPTFQSHKLLDSNLGKTVVAGAIIADATSLLLLSIYLQFTTGDGPTTNSLLVYPIALVLLGGFAWILPKLRWLALSDMPKDGGDMFERELRFTVLVLIGLVVFFEFVGLHAIIAGFFGGMILSKTMTNTLLKAKLHAISYGFFVPVFFVVVGGTTDLGVFAESPEAILLTIVMVASLVGSKFVSGWLGGRLGGFDNQSNVFMGFAVMPHLSTGLAVAYLGFGEGLLDQKLLSAIIGLTIVTSIISPIFVNIIGRKIAAKKPGPTVDKSNNTVLSGSKQAPTTVTDRLPEEVNAESETSSATDTKAE